jgi:hypothetical protein
VNKLLLSTTVLALLAAPGFRRRAQEAQGGAAPPRYRCAGGADRSGRALLFQHGDAPIWLRNDATRAAAARLSAILRRAPIDGFAAGPALAADVDAALALAVPGNAAAIRVAELRLSKAWVAYMQHLRTPPKGMSTAISCWRRITAGSDPADHGCGAPTLARR